MHYPISHPMLLNLFPSLKAVSGFLKLFSKVVFRFSNTVQENFIFSCTQSWRCIRLSTVETSKCKSKWLMVHVHAMFVNKYINMALKLKWNHGFSKLSIGVTEYWVIAVKADLCLLICPVGYFKQVQLHFSELSSATLHAQTSHLSWYTRQAWKDVHHFLLF